jgi:hypothetical protein
LIVREKIQRTFEDQVKKDGGGTSGLASGIDKQIQGSIASSEAGQLANTQNKITAADYATGRDNFKTALGFDALAGQYDPSNFGSEATQTNKYAFQETDNISQEQNAKSASVLEAVSSLAKAGLGLATGGIGNLDSTGSSTGGEQVGNFFSGGFTALAGG